MIIFVLASCSQLPKGERCRVIGIEKGGSRMQPTIGANGILTNVLTIVPDKKRYYCSDGIIYTI